MKHQPEFDVTLVGDTAMDLLLFGLPSDLPLERELLVERIEMVPGGSAAITAHNLAALGARVGFITAKGSDQFAATCLQQLAESGVDLSQAIPSSEPTGVTVMLQHEALRRALTYPGNGAALRFADLNLEYLCSARHFHLSSFFLQRELREDVPRLFATLKAAGLTISLDTNDDPWGGPPDGVASSLGYVDILMPNEREACRLAGISDPEQAVARLRREIPILVVKRGAAGATVFQGDFERTEPAIPCEFLDAVGAGDSFNAGFLRAFLRDDPLSECLRMGNLAGAFSTRHAGGITAFRDQAAVHAFFEANAASLR